MSARPNSVKAVFLLTMFKLILAWTFFAVFKLGGKDPVLGALIMKTAIAYVALAIPMFVLIHKHNANGVRFFLVLSIAASIPAKAIIGIVIDVVALGLTFGRPARAFFATAP